jgi:hypothetical protein
MQSSVIKGKKMDEEVKKAYKEAHELEPLFSVLIEALNRLGSFSIFVSA